MVPVTSYSPSHLFLTVNSNTIEFKVEAILAEAGLTLDPTQVYGIGLSVNVLTFSTKDSLNLLPAGILTVNDGMV